MTVALIKKVRDTISRYRMISPGDRIVVAVSGGPDSVCLLDVLHKIGKEVGLELFVAHLNHGLRPAEDDLETQAVKDLAGSLTIPLITEKVDLELTGSGSSLEERAREARYRFLETVIWQKKADKIAMGHTMNDQAETVIMRLLRGSGSSGLSGIPPVRSGTIIRPLYYIKRDEIEAYLKDQGLSYRLDSSNLNPTHLRNRIRHEILPVMTQLQPRLIEQLALTADILREEDEYLDTAAEAWIKKHTATKNHGSMAVPIHLLQNLHTALKNRVLRALIKKVKKSLLRIEYGHVLALSNLIQSDKPQGLLNLPGGLIAVKAYDRLVLSLNNRIPKSYKYLLPGPGRYYIDETDQTLTLTVIPAVGEIRDHGVDSTAFLDADRASFPLLVRNFIPGDRFIPLGMTGHKKIKDFFIDLKVTDKKRSSTPILLCGDKPVWVCGFRIDDRFKVTPSTKRLLKVAIESI